MSRVSSGSKTKHTAWQRNTVWLGRLSMCGVINALHSWLILWGKNNESIKINGGTETEKAIEPYRGHNLWQHKEASLSTTLKMGHRMKLKQFKPLFCEMTSDPIRFFLASRANT